jgi:transposase
MIDKKRIGRKTKLTPKLMERICDSISKGNYISTACQAIGIHKATYYNWLEQGERDTNAGIDSVFADFLQHVRKAEAENEQVIVNMVRDAAPKNWIAAMTVLERRHPERWGRRERHQVDVNETRKINITRVTVVVPNQGEETKVIQGQSLQAISAKVGKSLEDGEDESENDRANQID